MKRIAPSLLAGGLLVLAALSVTTRADAQAGAQDLRDLRPLVMLMVDTSGSMERQMNCTCADDACTNCLPNCALPNDGGGRPPDAKKSRWMVTLEALTGSFENYECDLLDRTANNGATYDLGYYRPYGQPWTCSSPDNPGGDSCKAFPSSGLSGAVYTQTDNGILDNFGDRARFGLMTFDGWDTYVGTGPLVDEAIYSRDRGYAQDGLWSYGSFHGAGLAQAYQRTFPGLEADTGMSGGAQMRVPGRFRYPNCPSEYQMDTGARGRNATEGALLSIDSCATPPCNMQNLADNIQEVLLDTRPWGGTPIAAMLEDLYFHLDEDDSDQFVACRPHYGVLITDGKPDDDYRRFGCDCHQNADSQAPGYCGPDSNRDNPSNLFCPYMRPADIARDLVTGRSDRPPLLEELHVIGLDLDDEARDALEEIAMEGGTELADVDDPVAFEQRLAGIVQSTFQAVSRTAPIFLESRTPEIGSPADVNVKQYEISTGFQMADTDEDPWVGFLERKRYICGGGGQGLVAQDLRDDTDRFHEVLNQQNGNRTLWTTLPNSGPADYRGVINKTSAGHCQANGSGCRDKVLVSEAGMFPGAPTVDDDDLQAYGSPDSGEVIAWMAGEAGTVREGKRLGDIFHSMPAVVGAPRNDTTDQAYNIFRQQPEVRTRPLTLYVNSNDGILHAFSIEAARDLGGSVVYQHGEEMWGFIPPLLMTRLKDQLVSHQFLLDGTPTVRDVRLSYVRAAGVNRALSNPNPYRTVLITGMRGAGNAYVALDVTDPRKPSFLWQFTDPDMGYTYGQPAIVQASFMFDSGGGPQLESRAVAVLAGGSGKVAEFDTNLLNLGALLSPAPNCQVTLGVLGDDVAESYQQPGNRGAYETYTAVAEATTIRHRNDIRCWQRPGRALYFVDVATGRLIKKLYDDNADHSRIKFTAPLIGSPVAFNNEIGSETSRLFITDADGVIWRIDMSDSTQGMESGVNVGTNWDDGWTARPFHDIFHDHGPNEGEVSLAKPLLTQDGEGRVVLVVGSGDGDNYAKLDARNRVVSLTEVIKPGTSGNSPDDWAAALNWQLMEQGEHPGFAVSELVTGGMTLHDGVVYLSSFISAAGGNACDVGRARMWALDYRERDQRNTSVNPVTYYPKLIDVYQGQLIDAADRQVNITAADAKEDLLLQTPTINDGVACTTITAYQTDIDVGYGNYDVAALTGGSGMAVIDRNASAPPMVLTAQASGDGAAQRQGSALSSVATTIDRRQKLTRIMSVAGASD